MDAHDVTSQGRVPTHWHRNGKMKKHSDVFEKRKAIILAVYKQDVAEHRRRCLAMKLQTDKLGDVQALVEQVAHSRKEQI